MNRGSSMHLPLVLEVPGSLAARISLVSETLSPVSFAVMTLDKCIILRIWTLTGCPLTVQGKSLPVQVKEPYGNLDMVT